MKLAFKLFVFFFLITIIHGCNNFKRFEQKKFFCDTNELKIDLIDILETRSIKKAYVTVSNKEYPVTINSLTDKPQNISGENFNTPRPISRYCWIGYFSDLSPPLLKGHLLLFFHL